MKGGMGVSSNHTPHEAIVMDQHSSVNVLDRDSTMS